MKNIITIFLLLIAFCSVAQTEDQNFNKFIELYSKQDYKGALKAIDKAIKESPDSFSYLSQKAYLHYRMGNPTKAVLLYNEIIEIEPSDDNYNGRGIAYESMMMINEAKSDYLSAAKAATNDTIKYSMYNNLAAANIKIRKFDEAYDYLLEAYNFDTTNLAVLNNLGNVCDEVGRGNETLKYLRKVVELDPNFVGGWVNIGFKLQLLGLYKESLMYFDKAIELDPSVAFSWNNRGYSKFKMEDYKGALKDINKSLELYELNSYANRNRALVYIAQGKNKKACEDIEAAISKGFVGMYGDEIIQLKAENCK
jgi:tetratricopeptide (TPR) repeat protein